MHRIVTSKLLGLGLALAVLVTILGWRFLLPIVPLDEGIVLAYPGLILHGYLPNLDFCSLYPPGNYWLMAIVFALFPQSVIVERLVGLGYIFACCIPLYYLAVRYSVLAAVITVSLAALVLQEFSDALGAYAWFGGVALLLLSIWTLARWLERTPEHERANLLMVAGVLSGAGIMFRHDLSPAILLSAVGMIGLRWRYLVRYGVGVAIGVLPLFIHTMVATPQAVFENLVTDVFRADAGRRLPIPWRSGVTFYIVSLGCLTPAVVLAVRSFMFSWDRRSRLLLGIALACLCILPQATSRSDKWHLAYVGFVSVPLAFVALLALNSDVQSGNARRFGESLPFTKLSRLALVTGQSAIVALVIFSAGASIKRFSNALTVYYRPSGAWACPECVTNEGRTVPLTRNASDLRTVLAALEAAAPDGSRVYIGPFDMARPNYNDTFIYFLLPRFALGQYYIEVANGVANRPGTRTIADLKAADFALLTTAYDQFFEPNASQQRGSEEPAAILQNEFCPMVSSGSYRLYRHCGARAS